MRVKPGNVIEITSPTKLSNTYIEDFIKNNESFIRRNIARLNTKPSINLNSIHYLGKEYNLIIINSSYDRVRVSDDSLIVEVKRDDNPYIRYVIHKFYAETLSEIVKGSIDRIKNDMNLHFDIAFIYKDVKTYFGKCYFERRVIALQTSLAKYEMKYILSVIYHECAHFYYQDHQSGFYNLLERHFPGYKKVQHELRMIKYSEIY